MIRNTVFLRETARFIPGDGSPNELSHNRRRRFFRALRLAFICLVVSASLFYGWDYLACLKTRQAYINGALIAIRAPIGGSLHLKMLRPGMLLSGQTLIGWLDNQRSPDLELSSQHLHSLVNQDNEDLHTVRAILAQREAQLAHFSRMSNLQHALDIQYAQSRLQHLSSERDNSLRWKDYITTEAQRWTKLAAEGAVTRSDAERRVSEAMQSLDGLHSREAELKQAEARLQASQSGLDLDGNRTISFPAIRQTELVNEISELKLRLVDLSAKTKQDTYELNKALSQLQLTKHADLKTAGSAVVWSINARDGELVTAGQPIVNLLNPAERWVETFLPESDLSRVHLGQKVKVQLNGSRHKSWVGTVESIRAGVGRILPGQFIAVPPPEKSRREAALHISIDWPQGSEASQYGMGQEEFFGVGRSVEVVF